MSVLIDQRTRVVVQGITGRDGSFHARQMLEYGTQVVAGVTPGKGGTVQDGVPVYDSVLEAAEAQHANASIIFVPPAFAADAILEAASSPRIKLVVCITEGVPAQDMARVYDQLRSRPNPPRLVGPNCPGLISPGKSKLGIMPGHIHKEGRIGLVSRSGTLTYEVVRQLTDAGLGQSTCIGIGGDPIIGTTHLHALEMFEADPGTEGVVLIGEIGGTDEEEAARYIGERMSKPVVGFIAGVTAPAGKRMGHAGAIVSGGSGTAADKIAALEAVGVPVASIPSEIPMFMKKMLAERGTAPRAAHPSQGPRGARPAGPPRRREEAPREPRGERAAHGSRGPRVGGAGAGAGAGRYRSEGGGYRTGGGGGRFRSEGGGRDTGGGRFRGPGARGEGRPYPERGGEGRPRRSESGAPAGRSGQGGRAGYPARGGPAAGGRPAPAGRHGGAGRPAAGGRPGPAGRGGFPRPSGTGRGEVQGRGNRDREDSRSHLRQESSKRRPATRGGTRLGPTTGGPRRGGR